MRPLAARSASRILAAAVVVQPPAQHLFVSSSSSRSLTRDLGGNRASTALLRSRFREITSDQRIHSIAEDVDNLETLEQLRNPGIDRREGRRPQTNPSSLAGRCRDMQFA